MNVEVELANVNSRIDDIRRMISAGFERTPFNITAMILEHLQSAPGMITPTGEALPTKFSSPSKLSYDAKRQYVKDGVAWVAARWKLSKHAVYHALYVVYSNKTKRNVWKTFARFQAEYGKGSVKSYLDVLDVLGDLDGLAATFYSSFGKGQPPKPFDFVTDVLTPASMIPRGHNRRRNMIALLAALPARRREKNSNRSAKGLKGNKKIAAATANVTTFKKSQKKTKKGLAVRTVKDEFSPQRVTERANKASERLEAMKASKQNKTQQAEPWLNR